MQKKFFILITFFWCFSLCSTQIGVKMISCIKDIQAEGALVIIGENEQRILSGSIVRDYTIGALYAAEKDAAYVPRTFNYENLEDIYKKNQHYGITVEKNLNVDKILTITEPVLERESFWCVDEKKEVLNYVYEPVNKPSKRAILRSGTFEYCGQRALEEAQGDLSCSYDKALYFGAQVAKKKTIAFLPLGIATGFPWQVAVEVAIKSVCEYVKKRPDDYKKIWLCIVKKSDDDSYPDNSHDMVYVKYWMELLKQCHN